MTEFRDQESSDPPISPQLAAESAVAHRHGDPADEIDVGDADILKADDSEPSPEPAGITAEQVEGGPKRDRLVPPPDRFLQG